METIPVFDTDSQHLGTFRCSVNTSDGAMLLIARHERLGRGTIVVPGQTERGWRLPCSILSIREAPPPSLSPRK